MEAFLRAIQPPLHQLDAALSAIPSSGVTVAHLRRIAGRRHRDALIEEVAGMLSITRPIDRVMFKAALLEDLVDAPAVGGGADGGVNAALERTSKTSDDAH